METENRFGMIVQEPVDYVQAYNGLLKSVKNTRNPYAILAKMEMFAQSSEHTAAVVDRILTELGLGGLSSTQLEDATT